MEKVFCVLGCLDNVKVKLACYKLESDEQRWWNGIKAVREEEFKDVLTWIEFQDMFYQQFFLVAEREAYIREYHNIKQREDEPMAEYVARFTRLVGFAGPMARTKAQRAMKFKWLVLYRYRPQLISRKYTSLTDVATDALEMEMERREVRREEEITIRVLLHRYSKIGTKVDSGIGIRTEEANRASGVDRIKTGIFRGARDRIRLVDIRDSYRSIIPNKGKVFSRDKYRFPNLSRGRTVGRGRIDSQGIINYKGSIKDAIQE